MVLRKDVAAIAFAFAGISVIGDSLRSARWPLTAGVPGAAGVWAAASTFLSLGFGVGIIIWSTRVAAWLFPQEGAMGLDTPAVEAWFEIGLGLLALYLLVIHGPMLLSALWLHVRGGMNSPASTPPATPTFDAFDAAMRQAVVNAVAGVGVGSVLLLTRRTLAHALAQSRWQLSQRAAVWIWLVLGTLIAFRLLASFRRPRRSTTTRSIAISRLRYWRSCRGKPISSATSRSVRSNVRNPEGCNWSAWMAAKTL